MIFDENGYEEALSATQAMADLTAKTVGKIYIDVALFKECYISAKYSCDFHGTSGPASHIKQIGHLVFWILKLRPFSLGYAFAEQLACVLKLKDFMSLIEKDYKTQKQRSALFFINEHLAIVIAQHLIDKGFDDIIAQQGDNWAEKDNLNNLKEANARRVERTAEDMAMSFREHNFASRAMAMMFHLAYSTGYES